MLQHEIVPLLDLVAAADGRNITEQTYAAWFMVIGHLDFPLAKEAALEAMADDTIRWIEPKDILAKVRKIRERRETDKRRNHALEGSKDVHGVPAPICIAHNKSIMTCMPCCDKAADLARSLDGVDGHYYQSSFWVEIARPA